MKFLEVNPLIGCNKSITINLYNRKKIKKNIFLMVFHFYLCVVAINHS